MTDLLRPVYPVYGGIGLVAIAPLGACTEGIREGWPESDIERWIVCGLPRDFNVLNAAQQRAALAERVPLTHTRWDALPTGRPA